MYVFEFMKRAVKNVGTWRALHLPIPSPDMARHVPTCADSFPRHGVSRLRKHRPFAGRV